MHMVTAILCLKYRLCDPVKISSCIWNACIDLPHMYTQTYDSCGASEQYFMSERKTVPKPALHPNDNG